MNLKMFGAAFFAAVFLGAPAIAADGSDVTVVAAVPTTTAPVTVAPTPAASDPADTIICRNIPPPLGTRIGGRRECATRREWQFQEDMARGMVHDAQIKPAMNPGSGFENLPQIPGRH